MFSCLSCIILLTNAKMKLLTLMLKSEKKNQWPNAIVNLAVCGIRLKNL